MTVAVSNTLLTNTFDYQRARLNEIAHALSNQVVTTNTPVTGNAVVNGYFSANNLVATTIRGGNLSVTSVLTVTSNLAVNGTIFTVGNSTINTVINSSSITVNSILVPLVHFVVNTQTSGTSTQVIDSYDLTTYRLGDYVISVKDNAANSHQAQKVIITHDVGAAYLSVYGVVSSNVNLGTFTANANATHVRLYFTPTVSNTQVKAVKTLVVV